MQADSNQRKAVADLFAGTGWHPALVSAFVDRNGDSPLAWQIFVEAMKDPAQGPSWVRAFATCPFLHDYARAIACKALGRHHDGSTIEVAERLLESTAGRLERIFAAESLAGPWGVKSVGALSKTLLDTRSVGDMWSLYRVSNAAALTLHAIGTPAAMDALVPWLAATERDLASPNPDDRRLAAIVLARLDNQRALEVLREIASHPDEWQAQGELAEVTGPKSGGEVQAPTAQAGTGSSLDFHGPGTP